MCTRLERLLVKGFVLFIAFPAISHADSLDDCIRSVKSQYERREQSIRKRMSMLRPGEETGYEDWEKSLTDCVSKFSSGSADREDCLKKAKKRDLDSVLKVAEIKYDLAISDHVRNADMKSCSKR